MKQLFTILAMTVVGINMSYGYDFTADELTCTILSAEDKTVSVSLTDKDIDAAVVIPQTVSNDGVTYTVTEIEESGFFAAHYLRDVTIPPTITKIGNNAFFGCRRIPKVNISDIAAWCNIEFGNESSNPLCNFTTLYLNGEEVINLVIPEGVTKIGNYAFQYCENITSVALPATLKTIGEEAFYGCTSLATANIPDLKSWLDIEFKTTYSNPVRLTKQLNVNGQKLVDVVIPEGVTEIKNYAFLYNDEITSVTFPSTLTTIGKGAFEDCDSLKYITITPALTSVAEDAFTWDYEIVQVNISDLNAWCKIDFADGGSNPLSGAKKLYLNGEQVVDLVTPETITEIKPNAFYGGPFSSVTISPSVTTIGKYAFMNCRMASLTLPPSVTTVGASAFSWCSYLKKVNISDLKSWCNIDYESPFTNPLNYGEHLYLNGEEITELVIPEGVTELKSGAFFNALAVTSLTLGNDVKKIGKYTFAYMESLPTLTLPATIESIDENAFTGSSALQSVTCQWTEPIAANENIFDDSVYEQTLYVPAGTTEKYSATTPWNKFSTIKEIGTSGIDSVTTDSDSAISTSNSKINVVGNEPVRIISPSGTTIYTGEGNCSVSVDNGVYIVVAGDKTTKVAVK